MSIRPIDLQVLIPRTEEISRKQHSQQEKNQAESGKFMMQFQQQVKNRQTQVQNSEKSGQEKINQENKDKEQQRQKQQRQKKESQPEEKAELTDPIRGKLIDIKT